MPLRLTPSTKFLKSAPSPALRKSASDLHMTATLPTPVSSPGTSRQSKAGTTRTHMRNSSHWAADGNIVIQISDTRFKLHRSRLTQNSAWFRDLFESRGSLSGDSISGSIIDDGEEVISLDGMGFSAKDFEELLEALDNFIDFFYTKPSFHVVSSILRTATALSFVKLSSWASRYLTEMWPRSLDQLSETRIPYATESVDLGYRCGVPVILKRALYELVRTEGFGQDNPPTDNHSSGSANNSSVQLTFATYKALAKAREKLTSIWIVSTTLPPTQGAKCESEAAECATRDQGYASVAYMRLVHHSGIFEQYLFDPVCGFQALADAPWAEEGFCQDCVDLRKEAWEKAKDKTWRSLDVWFGLLVVNGQ